MELNGIVTSLLVNLLSQTQQGQSVTKLATPLQIILIGNASMKQETSIKRV